MQSNIKMLIVDDEPLIIRSLKVALPWDELGIEIIGEARNGEKALELFLAHLPDLILSDIRMPSINGLELMKKVHSVLPQVIFILISGYDEREYAKECLKEGAFDFLLKPIDHDELEVVVNKAIEKVRQASC